MDITLYKKVLKERNMTYVDLSEKTGLSVGCIKRIMAGIAKYPRIDTIETIERALGIDSKERLWSDRKKVGITADEEEMLDVFREIGEKYGAEAQARAIELLRLAFRENNK